ncbi:adhesion G-protein coupled receptor G4-like isoform X3 [Lates japonicus]|uniref:Adhesion G-protein coupled receptor G4-like isoform X3 n=1 Tax=Lates japonicus TaxID=270547 RepID=A0AAD3NFN6_LATJO|nr:adhesion G-protein coupled receptor G4-like isoform X3 [Lates japonicus]
MSSPSPLTICLCIQLSLCLLGSNASAGTSLWGKKGQFGIRPCLWQLDSKVVVPALTELSVCILLRHKIAAKWTAFVYKAPGGIDVELGLRGTTTQLTVLLFGVEQTLESNLRLREWYSVCLTWSGQAQRLRVYINNTILGEAPVNRTQRLAPNGTLTLGVSHNVDANGKVQPETGNGLIAIPAAWLIIQLLYMCDNLSFSCEVYVNVDPAANVGEVQTDIAARLSLPFFYNFLNLTADPSSINILPVGNAAEVVDIIQDLVDVQLGNSDKLTSSELNSVVEKLNEVVDVSVIRPTVGADIVNIIADLLLSKTNVTPVANIINNTHVFNLTDRVVVTLTHQNPKLDVSRTDTSETDSLILTLISYLGCGISSIFLGITLLTYLAFEKLRRDYPSKILINLSAALLGLSMLFLLNSWLSSFSNYGLCIATAATLHYFLLASFTWMGLEAIHMYFALVKVFNTYIPSYIFKFCAVGWGVPLVIVSLVLAIDKDAYGNAIAKEATVIESGDPFCWLQNDVFFYVTVVAFVLLILLCNTSVFIVVLIQIRQMSANKPSANSRSSLQDLRAVASLTVLLGLTWSMGFFSFGPGRVVLMYLFTIFNTLQGFFVFLFHCLMKENVRKQWRIHLCCGRLRLSDYSDWSHSVTVGGHGKKSNLVNSNSGASNSTFTIRKISDSSTSSEQNHRH